jgi:transposase-like protein
MDYDNDCKSIFYEDVYDKKKTGRSAFSKTNCTRKRNGGMPSDFLKGKALREYMGNSEVKVYNLKDLEPKKHRGASRRFTKEIEDQICAAYLSGKTYKEIRTQFNINSNNTLGKILRRNGVECKRYSIPKKADNFTAVDAAEVLTSECDPELEETEPTISEIEIKLIELQERKIAMLMDENEKYKTALLNLALRLI